MCLTNIKVEKNIKTRKVYKVLQATRKVGNNSKVLKSNFSHTWSRGLNKSSRKDTKVTKDEKYDKRIAIGFHVFKYKKDAIKSESLSNGYIVVELIAKSEDYVASGLNNYCNPGMVYTKLYLLKAEYDKKVRKALRAFEKSELEDPF